MSDQHDMGIRDVGPSSAALSDRAHFLPLLPRFGAVFAVLLIAAFMALSVAGWGLWRLLPIAALTTWCALCLIPATSSIALLPMNLGEVIRMRRASRFHLDAPVVTLPELPPQLPQEAREEIDRLDGEFRAVGFERRGIWRWTGLGTFGRRTGSSLVLAYERNQTRATASIEVPMVDEVFVPCRISFGVGVELRGGETITMSSSPFAPLLPNPENSRVIQLPHLRGVHSMLDALDRAVDTWGCGREREHNRLDAVLAARTLERWLWGWRQLGFVEPVGNGRTFAFTWKGALVATYRRVAPFRTRIERDIGHTAWRLIEEWNLQESTDGGGQSATPPRGPAAPSPHRPSPS